ncbi:MAG: FAD-dependent monooxygenase [Janthinobacterium lividum]
MQAGDEPILIVGGGIGGIGAALGLGLAGKRVKLLEQSAEIAPIGYGVQIGPNVLPMLAQLGVADAVREAAYLPDELLLYEALSGEVLVHIPLKGPAFEARYPAPYIAIHRVDLHEILLRACRQSSRIDLNQATTVAGFEQTEQGVTVLTADGGRIAGAALIAADGLRSKLRSQMYPDDVARDTGYVAHRAIVPMADAPPRLRKRRGVTMWTSAGFHVIYYPLRAAHEMNIVAVFEVPPGMDATDHAGYRRYIAEKTAHAQPEVQDVISLVNLERRWAIADRNPIRRWAQGRVTLLGDSAHATLQSLAQGAGMAVEDVVTLAALVKQHGDDYAAAFAAFQSARFLRTARVTLESRALWHTYHCGGDDAAVRTQQLQERGTEDFYRCFDWLWQPAARQTGVH